MDLTTTVPVNELAGVGPNCLEAATDKSIPQVVSVGAPDVVNVDPAPTVPAKFDDRRFVRRDVRRPRNAGPWERTISKKLRIALSDRVLFPPRFFGN